MKHSTVAVFIPHEGCPCQCAFCDQRSVSGEIKAPSPDEVREIAEKAAKSLQGSAQIAFFGGSFTAVDRVYMKRLLECVQEYIDKGIFYGIRISTRPDCIDPEVLRILKAYRVTDIELGVQSMSDDVLKANKRGHTAEDSVNASKLIRSYELGLGLQMMTGLYKSDPETDMLTAQVIARLKPDTVRIYPTVILRGTELERLYGQGKYSPQTLEEAVELGSDLLRFFSGEDIRVIRMGLHDSPGLAGSIVAGPRHPAFRELCEGRILLRKTLLWIQEKGISKGKILILTAPGAISKMAGQKRENLNYLERMGYAARIIPDSGKGYLEIEILQRM